MSQKTYEQLVQRVIGSPKTQSEHYADIQRQPDDSPEDWARMLDDIGTVEHIRLRWNPEESMA